MGGGTVRVPRGHRNTEYDAARHLAAHRVHGRPDERTIVQARRARDQGHGKRPGTALACSAHPGYARRNAARRPDPERHSRHLAPGRGRNAGADLAAAPDRTTRSEEHTSELQSLMRISYAVFCLK